MRSLLFMLALCALLGLALARLAQQRRRRARREFAQVLRAAVDGRLARYAWLDFLAADLADPELLEIRSHIAELPARYPPEGPDRICGPEGTRILEHYLSTLTGGRSSKASRSTIGR
ncbi:MAG: hypothetical protein JSU66_14045 [Deltaproteobacteria bacterium]|nr:MAG: hypothetical protein JSU66_14045 [Deltaproteobacteria bacterium]